VRLRCGPALAVALCASPIRAALAILSGSGGSRGSLLDDEWTMRNADSVLAFRKAVAMTKLFISYSWSCPDHETWVLRLATELRDAGIDAILDKWDLREGHDAYAFMERMVSDSDVKKVIMVCDQAYATKADRRLGGVGAEAQIITPEIYSSQDQSKFVAVLAERDSDGNPCVPSYYKSRIYIDLSDPSSYAQNFETLLRWAFDQPLYRKPELGRKPTFLAETENSTRLSTTASSRRCLDALRNSRDYAVPAMSEYLAIFSEELEKFRISNRADPIDEAVVRSFDEFTPYRDEFLSIVSAAARYRDNEETRIAVHRFFESIAHYMERPADVRSWGNWDFDNFKLIIYELFLLTVACFVKAELFEAAENLMQSEYYVGGHPDQLRRPMSPFSTFNREPECLGARNARLGLRRLSLRADLIKERCKGIGIDFQDVMVADFVLFLRSRKDFGEVDVWWPDTLVYASRNSSHFGIFARSRSSAYFEKVKALLGVHSKGELGDFLTALEADPHGIPRWQFDSLNPRLLLGFEMICTRP
jgi:hypothetical protein